MHNYRLLTKKGQGAFSQVFKAQHVSTQKIVAIKCMKNHFTSRQQVNNLRQIQALRRLSQHPQIISLLQVLYDQPRGCLALVFQLMDLNLYQWIKGRRHYLPQHKVKYYIYNLLKAIDHMHRNGIFHRDIKPQNVLISQQKIKLADFGSCRGVYNKQPYTQYISTRWYRPPQCLLTDGFYNYKMDIWGVGCVFFQVLALFPLFPGTNQLDQVHKIHSVLGTPPPDVLMDFQKKASHMEVNFQPCQGTGIDKLIPHVTPLARDLISKLLAYKVQDRLSARNALKHPYFKGCQGVRNRSPSVRTPEADTAAGEQSKLPPLKVQIKKKQKSPYVSNKSLDQRYPKKLEARSFPRKNGYKVL